MVQTALSENPFSGHVFVFRGRRGDLIKLLWWDGDGLCLFAKRLERGRFIWPKRRAERCCDAGTAVHVARGDRLAAADSHASAAEAGKTTTILCYALFLHRFFVFVDFFLAQEKMFWHTAHTMTLPITLSELRRLDPEVLAAMVLTQQEQLLSKDEQLASRDTEIEHLKLLIAKLRRMKFGRSSEKLDRQIEQIQLRLEELQTSQAENKAGSVAAKQSTSRIACQCRYTAAVAGAPAAGNAEVPAETSTVPRLWRNTETTW